MELSIENEPIEVTMMDEPDLSWSYTDSHGHTHRYTGEWYNAKVETIELVYDVPEDEIEWYDESEYGAPCHLECKQCRDRVPSPGRSPSMARRYIAGETRYKIDDIPCSKEQYEEAMRTRDYPRDWPYRTESQWPF